MAADVLAAEATGARALLTASDFGFAPAFFTAAFLAGLGASGSAAVFLAIALIDERAAKGGGKPKRGARKAAPKKRKAAKKTTKKKAAPKRKAAKKKATKKKAKKL